MQENPEEGRLTPEAQAEQLREARKKTTQMKRQYRKMRRDQESEAKAGKWAKRHEPRWEDTYDDMQKVSNHSGPLNRAGRRQFAKKMNVFKTPDGWSHFNQNYSQKFGKRESLAKGNVKVIPNNMKQALAAAKVTPKKEIK